LGRYRKYFFPQALDSSIKQAGEMSDKPETGQTIDSEAAAIGHHDERRQRGWPGFWPWLVITALLAALVTGLWWHLENRLPQIVEVTGPTPPPADPAPELVQRAIQFRQLIALRQAQLGERIAALDPPQCTPPAIADLALLEQVRRQEAPNITRWRALLVPMSLAPDAGRTVRQPAPSTEDAAPLHRRLPAPAGDSTDGTAPDRESVLAPTPPITGSDIAALSTERCCQTNANQSLQGQ
jgi:hypothetical protein